jgi:Uri superfamily endonuclease
MRNTDLRENTPVNECQADQIPSRAGAYVLEFHLRRAVVVRAGSLGELTIGPGRVRYYGSARGPGGLRARVARHLDPSSRRDRWHVDGLSRVVRVERVLIEPGGKECELVRRDLETGRWQVAARGFGSSDCRNCPSHLLVSVLGGDC